MNASTSVTVRSTSGKTKKSKAKGGQPVDLEVGEIGPLPLQDLHFCRVLYTRTLHDMYHI